ncbi:MAG: hypothetical protein ACJ8JD_10495 [Chthoniobacterales bacterium]
MKRCYALSGVYDMRDSMDGMYDDNFYFNNPVDYMANHMIPGSANSSRPATSTSPPAPALEKFPAPPTKCPKSFPAPALIITSTTGARKAATNGPTGITQMWEYVGAHF